MKTRRARVIALSLPIVAIALSSFVVSPSAWAAEARPKSAKPSESKYEKYKELASRHGMKPRSDRALVIGIRGRDLAGRLHPLRIQAGYRDTLVILTPDRHVIELAVSTHPWEKAAPGVPDVNGDGKADVGMIRPGKYIAVRRDPRRNIAGAPTYHLLTTSGSGKLPGFRNTDQDDRFSAAEQRASAARGDSLTAVLFHQEGGEGDPRPVGCQILDAEAMRRFAEAVGERFDYLLVDVSEGAPASIDS